MTVSLYDLSVPLFINSLSAIPGWLDKAAAEGKDEAAIMEARLAPDMRPFPNQIQIASDGARRGVARVLGVEPPAMADTETSFAELKARCTNTVAWLKGVDRAALDARAADPVEVKFPNGMGWSFPSGTDFIARFALPNFYFHVTTTYALLRAAGVTVGKGDYLSYMGAPTQL